MRSVVTGWRAAHWGAALTALLLTIAVLLPGVRTASPHHDEYEYLWSAAYFGGKLAVLDLSPQGTSPWTDPGWGRSTFWTQTQPMGTRFVIAVALGLAGAEPPSFTASGREGKSHPWFVEESTAARDAGRIAAILCAAMGLAAIALRLGWLALLPIGLFLAIPHVRDDLTRAWAEGPLLLGFGLCVLWFGTRRFVVACALAATFKLTALVAWPLLLWPRAVGGLRPIVALLGTSLLWAALTPPSWFVGGPPFLALMSSHRADAFSTQSALFPGLFGLFIPTRYLWLVELGLLLATAWLVAFLLGRAPTRWRPAFGFGRATIGAAVRR